MILSFMSFLMLVGTALTDPSWNTDQGV